MEILELIIESPGPQHSEILVAILSQLGFDSFVEEDGLLKAYIPKAIYNEGLTREALEQAEFIQNKEFTIESLPDINWNERWEKNYQPVSIGSKVIVRAPFHQSVQDVLYDILIQPQMSFGTAHHETTSLMIEWMLEMEIEGCSVLDMGCGTGVLAILANKMNAGSVMAVDIDEWAYKNTRSNTELNEINDIQVLMGDIEVVINGSYDVILANINRNTLLEHIPDYRKMLKDGGKLLISGYYREDLNLLEKKCKDFMLYRVGFKTNNQWAAALFTTVQQD